MVDFSVFLGGSDSSKKRKKYNVQKNEPNIDPNDDAKDDFVISLEECITTNFDRVISRQLDGDWHRLSFKVKQLVKDLGKLRQLFHHLIHYDSIDFLNFLEGVKAMNAVSVEPSLWLGEYSGENVFRIAKERVYRVSQKGKLITVLEENMKEALLRQVLTEIQTRRKSEGANDGTLISTGSNNVLLMVKDERALKSVREYLLEGGKRSIAKKWLRYLERVNEKTRSLLNSMEGGLKSLSGEQRLLYEEEPRVRNTIFPRGGNKYRAQMPEVEYHDSLAASKRKRRKIAVEKSRGRHNADLYEDQALFEEKIESSRLPDAHPHPYNYESDLESASEDEDERLFNVEPIEEMSLFVRAFSQMDEGEASLLLQDLQPDTVVMYDSDASFIRTLEIYANTMMTKSAYEKKRLQVFFLLYESCAEEISFTKALERETEAFNRLIDFKKRMPSLVSAFNSFSTQEMQQSHGGFGGSYAGGTFPLSMDTRTGRGKQNVTKERRDIAVDVREFRAKLPSVLHQGGMRLAPATLIVGDYVLSDVHCVERKSISDFYQSMDNSSRLKDQVEKMAKHYKIPILLLEFDPEKSFQLQNANELGNEIRKNSITSKLCILVTAFPMLRILWSRSPHETLKVFKKLKRNHQEVDVIKAIDIGTNDAMDEFLGGGPDGYYNEDNDEGDGANEAAVQMLLRLPGVTGHNARQIMRECDSIAELADMSREQLQRIVGQKNGQKLFTFFRQSFS
jgi:DNA excision repair protein ERCC-4